MISEGDFRRCVNIIFSRSASLVSGGAFWKGAWKRGVVMSSTIIVPF